MSPETIIGIVVAGVVALSLIGKLLPKRQPKETHFKCSRCGANSRHTERTIEAWRNNKTKFFCQSCHAKWLQSRPPQEILKSRLYLPDPVKAMEKFNLLLLSSYKENLPVRPGKGSKELNTDLLTQLPLLLHIGPFSKTFLPGITESTRRMAEAVIESRE